MQSFRLVVIASMLSTVAACASEDDTLTPDPGSGGGGSGGSSGSSGTGGATALTASADCNLNGVWAGHQLVRALALNLPQHSNSYYYIEVSQPAGSVDWEMTKEFDCGIHVIGTVLVVLPRATLEAHMTHNSQVGRKGKMGKNAIGNCELSSEKFWQLLGARDQFVPARNTDEEIPAVTARLPLPTRAAPDGAEDWDNDGYLGVAWQATGLASGTRNTVQRSWLQWFSNEEHTITPALDFGQIVVRADFDSEDSVFDPESGPLATPSTSDRRPEAPNRTTLKFLGRDPTDPRGAAIIHGTDPKTDLASAVETCLAIQSALPPVDG